ncbi:MAG: aldehyde dehydrogenase family protein, partial [Porticoccaceae bacterium]|nr:aldehyde dehydrogenase family protein [Porticoccaceae bacterium]
MSELSARLQSVFDMQSQHKWVNKASTAEQRIEKLLKLKAVIQSREDDVVRALHADLRKDDEGARNEAIPIYGEVDQTVAELANWMTPAAADPTPFVESRAKIISEGRGIVLLFSPWNYPFALLFQPLVSIIAAGNCALVKPNELAPNVSKLSAEIINEVFDEKDVAVFEGSVDLANEMLELPIDHIFFTGSPAV